MSRTVPENLIFRPAVPEDVPALQELFREYARGVGNQICFQTFEEEVATLPGPYARPDGNIIIAATPEKLAGCVAMRALTLTSCEMKRLYVRPEFRRFGIAQSLIELILQHSDSLEYRTLNLDTLPEMKGAIALYRRLNFRPIPPYGNNPPNALCFQKLLKSH